MTHSWPSVFPQGEGPHVQTASISILTIVSNDKNLHENSTAVFYVNKEFLLYFLPAHNTSTTFVHQ